jgi:hypothetical protein
MASLAGDEVWLRCYTMILRSPTPDDRRRESPGRGAPVGWIDDNVKRRRRHYESTPLSFLSSSPLASAPIMSNL